MRILLIQLKRAGDLLVTTPVIAALRAHRPGAELYVLTQSPFAPLLEGDPAVTRVIRYDSRDLVGTLRRLREVRADLILDFQSSPRSVIAGLASGVRRRAGYRVPFWGRFFTHTVPRPRGATSVVEGKFSLVESVLGPIPSRPDRRIVLSEAEHVRAQAMMPPVAPGSRVVGLIPTHRQPSRRWRAEGFKALAQALCDDGCTVWWFWGPGEEQDVRALAQAVPASLVIPPTGFRDMAALLARCAVVITNDSGPMHLAVCAGAPTVTLYGPTDPANWNPGGPRHRIVQARGVACLGCNLNHCPFSHECMLQISPGQVLEATRSLLGGS